MIRLKHQKRAVAGLIAFLMLACTLAANAQSALPVDAQQVLRQTILQLQAMADQYTRAGQAAPARAIQDEIQRLQTNISLGPLLPSVNLLSSQPLDMSGYRNRVGETFRVRVSAAVAARRGIWGNDIYTDDSDISTAVVHAGVLAFGQDGEVLITFLPGQNQYQGSTRNGLTSNSWGSYQGSYRLGKVDAASAALPILPASTSPAASLATASLISLINSFPNPNVPPNSFTALDEQSLWQLLGGQASGTRASSGPNLGALRSRINESFEFEVTGKTTGSIWGDGIYTDDSDLSLAAVHAGMLSPGEKGRVRFTILPGQQQYVGATKNSVSSQTWGSWIGSFRFEGSGRSATPVVRESASISGRITDSAGRPIANAFVLAMVIGFNNGRRTISEIASTTTGVDGDYRFASVLPGNYLVGVIPSRSATGNPPPAYFPGVSDLDVAQQIPVRSRQQVVSIDFAAVPATLFKVTGKVANPPASGVPNLSVVQRDPSKPAASAAMLLANVSPGKAQGEFELMLPAGTWDVFPVTARNGPGPAGLPPAGVPAYISGRTTVNIADRNVDTGSVTLGATDITGRIVIDPAIKLPDGFSISKLEVRLAAVDGTPAPLWHHASSVKSGTDGRFTFSAVPPGEYTIQVSPPIPNAYVADIRSGPTSVFDRGTLRVKPESLDPVEVVFRAGGGTIQGTVQLPATSSVTSGKVVLIPATAQRKNPLLYKQDSFTTSERDFHFSNVAPGQYKIFAFESLPAGGAEMNAEFISKYEGTGVSITVAEAGSATVSIRMIEAEN